MSPGVRLLLLLALVLPLMIAPGAGSAPGVPVPHCSPDADSCGGWFTGNVTVSWTYDLAGVTQTTGCNVRTITADGITSHSCEVTYGDSSFARTVTIRRDATPPQVTGSALERPPDHGDWYNRAVSVVFSGIDATSGLEACDRTTYGGPDGAAVAVQGVCRDAAGNTSAAAAATLRFDASPPVVTVAADRPPDGRNWYRRPLTISFSGSDPVSGVASCVAPVHYAGPDRAEASVVGTCRDAAGNVALDQQFALNYDATAPRLEGVRVKVAKGVAHVGWYKPPDAVVVRIDRIPGVNGALRTQVYRGTGESFRDRTVRDGVRYRYILSAADVAGNVSASPIVTGAARPSLFLPPAGAAVRAPVVLAWKSAAGARYYNVQLHRNGVKVLTAWPRVARFRLEGAWRYLGRRQTLRPGTYTWFVWPGSGSPELPRYGRLLGTSRFLVKR